MLLSGCFHRRARASPTNPSPPKISEASRVRILTAKPLAIAVCLSNPTTINPIVQPSSWAPRPPTVMKGIALDNTAKVPSQIKSDHRAVKP